VPESADTATVPPLITALPVMLILSLWPAALTSSV
jgi:hypothetical protein